MLNEIDLIIAGFHEPVFAPQDRAANTEAMIARHGAGRMSISSAIRATQKYPVDIPAIAAAAAKYQVALELNNSSFIHSRKGSESNCRAIAAAVRDAGGWLALGSDSHVAFALGGFEHCERILEEVDFPQERVLNVSPRRILNFLEQRGRPAIAELADL
ncbi:Probable phosphatase YcdX [Serratia fonticola]|uniref:Probable phosphatase YcdX n=1 Tax=Serratia fonticola TaxID=47917 RepID=A0A4U9TGU5_SERFO|nr:Probable phosphatase YcdX [Serratia fonticola]